MSRRDDRLRLRHMLDHAREAIAMTEGRSRADLNADRQFNLALVHLAEIVGEAAARVKPETQARLTNVPWAETVGLRNRLIHGYDQVDFDILWDAVVYDFPPLVAALERFLAQSD